MGSLFVTAGPNKGELFPIAMAEAVIGRDPGCSFQLTDGRVSRQHCRIALDPDAPGSEGGRLIVDLGSANGTVVNGVKLTAPTPLKDGDTIALGNTVLRFAAKQLSTNPAVDTLQHIPKQSEKFRQTALNPSPNRPSRA